MNRISISSERNRKWPAVVILFIISADDQVESLLATYDFSYDCFDPPSEGDRGNGGFQSVVGM